MGLLALIPGKDLIYAAIIAALLIGFGVYTAHEREIGAQRIEAADKAASVREIAVAEANNAQLTSRYEAKLKDTEDAYQLTLKSAVDRADTLAGSLRNYTNRRCGRPVPAGAAAASQPNASTPVPGSSGGIDAATQRVFDAAAADAAQLQALEAERASLTRK